MSLLPHDYAVRDGVQSGPGLVPLLTSDALQNKGRIVVQGRPVILVTDEWSRLAQVGGIQNSTLLEDINSLFQRWRPWTMSRSHREKSGGDIVVENPSLSILGTTTNTLFQQSITARQVSGGFVNRYLILPGRGEWQEYLGESPQTPALHGGLDPLKAHAWGLGQELKLAYSPAAWEMFLNLQMHWFKPIMEDSETSEMMKRLHFYLHHISLIYAWSEKAPVIERHHQQAAIQVVNTSYQFLLSLLEKQSTDIEPQPFQRRAMGVEQRIQAKVAREPGVSKRKLMQDLHRAAGCEELGRCLESMLKAGLVGGKSGPHGQVLLFPVRGEK